MKNDLSKTYNPTEFENEMYTWWESNDYFRPEKQDELGITNDKSPSYCITIPPPNVTGVLHLGHAMIISIQDLMIRYHRMQGNASVFIPGTDHAGIATQNVVERELDKQGIKRKEIGREKFVDKVWEWKEKSHATIIKQSKKMGLSADWQRERFTMDEKLSKAVREAFVNLYEKDLIYKGSYIINWCSGRCESAISSLEAIPEDVDGHLWYIRYPIKTDGWHGPTADWGSGSWARGADRFIEIATTRPETLLGDTAIATSSKHPKFGKMIGSTAILPVLSRELKIIEDEHVDPEFGTGALKITPSHDFNDYEVGKRHNLEMINIFDKKSVIVEEYGGPYAGMDRFEGRAAIVEDLEKEGLLIKVEEYQHSVPHCERCHTVIEPRDSVQWFVRTTPLAEKVLKLMDREGVEFIPPKFDDRFRYWMENILDWCISRQLWWGHRIPVWYCRECDAKTCTRDDPEECQACGSKDIYQDEDVLDTWFSSALWPFSTLGWPENTDDLRRFYPNTMRETGYDILLFWVAREMMMGAELTETLPYHSIYFHGLIRNEQGRKISKSMENIEEYDPLRIISTLGADTLRYTLINYSTPGLDMNLDPKNLEATHKFGNKIWQASKFLLGNIPDDFEGMAIDSIDIENLEIADRWILSELHSLIRDVTNNFEEFNYMEASRAIRRFVWGSFADWYIEISKLRIYEKGDTFDPTHILLHCLDTIMRLLHPFMPFITEKLWQALPALYRDQKALIISQWPKHIKGLIDEEIEADFKIFMNLVVSIRRIRGEYKVKPNKRIPITIAAGKKAQILKLLKDELCKLAILDVDTIKIQKTAKPPKDVVSDIVDGISFYIPLEGLVELEEEISRLEKEIGKLQKMMDVIDKKLNSEFANRAPKELVDSEKKRLKEFKVSVKKLEEQKSRLEA